MPWGAVDVVSAAIDINSFVNPDAEKRFAEAWQFLSGSDLDTELDPVAWVVEALGIAPGAVTIIGGAGFGGKTVSMQSLALSVASGMPAWGMFPVARGRVIHLDWEQGRRLTQDRYQRLARYMGLRLADCDLTVACLPTAHLDDERSEAVMCRIVQGARLCIIDAFRGAFPKAQENDSGVRSWLDMLQRVSDRTGCAIIVIAHSRKMSQDVDVRSSLRGSGALFDACQTCYMLDGAKNRPTQVHNTKDRLLGETRETFGLVVADVEGVHNDMLEKRWGLRVTYASPADVQAAYSRDDDGDDNSLAINVDRIESVGKRMLAILAGAPDGLQMSTLKGALFGMPMQMINAALPVLISTGAVHQDGKGPTAVFRAIVEGRQPGDD